MCHRKAGIEDVLEDERPLYSYVWCGELLTLQSIFTDRDRPTHINPMALGKFCQISQQMTAAAVAASLRGMPFRHACDSELWLCRK